MIFLDITSWVFGSNGAFLSYINYILQLHKSYFICYIFNLTIVFITVCFVTKKNFDKKYGIYFRSKNLTKDLSFCKNSNFLLHISVSELNEFKPRLKSPQKPVIIERRLKSWKIEYNFKWNQPYLSRGLN